MAGSRFALTITSLLCLVVWIVAGLATTSGGWNMESAQANPLSIHANPLLVTLPCVALATYMMAELNNANTLIRIYSRMVSCAFLVMMTMATFQYTSIGSAVVALCMAMFYRLAFSCYQDGHSMGRVYYASLCLSIASLFFVQVLFFLPLLWLLLSTKLYTLTFKSFCASLIGLITPYWFWTGYSFYKGQTDVLVNHFAALGTFEQLCDFSILSLPQMVTGGFIVLCACIGTIHYLGTRHMDSIRTQMLYEFFCICDYAAILFLVLQPQHYAPLLGIIIVNTAPLIAHFIALTRTRWTNYITIGLLLLTVAITVFNLWNPSLNF